MASLTKDYSRKKLFGQIYTPNFIVCKILDDIGYNDSNILGKTILDPACGDGRFLIEIAKRIINYSPKRELQYNLEKIYGWDIDSEAIKICLSELNNLIEPYNIEVNWNIQTTNSIFKYSNYSLFSQTQEKRTFDFIVGNPPYIRIQHLDEEQRQYIQSNYTFCKSGSTDIYIAFYELCLNLLNENGICGLITPNTFFYTETARPMRQFFENHKNLVKITNYANIQLFGNATTYSAITIFGLKKQKTFRFEKALSETTFETKDISFTELKEPFWQLSTDNITQTKGKRLGEIAKIHVGITTLCDKAYIFTIEELDGNYVMANTKLKGKIKIEKGILKPIIKASTLKKGEHIITEYILFPYEKIDGKHKIIQEDKLKEKYLYAYEYLLSVKPELDRRDNGKPNAVSWYAFGRSQGLDTSFGEKIVFSLMNIKPNFIYVDNKDCTFYSGYCIKYNGNIRLLLDQLNSDRMRQFIEMSGRDFRGGWKAYNKKIIENFEININNL